MIILPFSVSNVYQGFATASGIAQINCAGLQLELAVKDAGFGRIRPSRTEIQIPYYEMSSAILKSNWLATQLIIQMCRIATVSQFPDQESGKITLSIARCDRKTANVLFTQLESNIIEAKLNRLNQVVVQLEEANVDKS